MPLANRAASNHQELVYEACTQEGGVSHKPGCICVECERESAERKAWDSLGRYKFQMFGYWAAIWVHMNRLCAQKKASREAGLSYSKH